MTIAITNKQHTYIKIVQFMQADSNKEMYNKLNLLIDIIKVDADLSPSSASLDVFGFNLFIFSYEQYIKLCEELDNDPRYYSKSHIRN